MFVISLSLIIIFNFISIFYVVKESKTPNTFTASTHVASNFSSSSSSFIVTPLTTVTLGK